MMIIPLMEVTVTKAKYTEVELGEMLIPWLESEGWDVYQEVQFRYGGHRADLACLKDGQLWIIELKISLGLPVIEQAERWKVHYRSVGVKSSRRRSRFPRRVCEAFELGLIEIDEYSIHEVLSPPPMDVQDAWVQGHYIDELDELHKTMVKAGSKHGGYLTKYRRSMIQIQEYIEAHPGCDLQELYDALGKLHWAHERSFKQCVHRSLTSFETWCDPRNELPEERVIGKPKFIPRVWRYYIKEEEIDE